MTSFSYGTYARKAKAKPDAIIMAKSQRHPVFAAARLIKTLKPKSSQHDANLLSASESYILKTLQGIEALDDDLAGTLATCTGKLRAAVLAIHPKMTLTTALWKDLIDRFGDDLILDLMKTNRLSTDNAPLVLISQDPPRTALSTYLAEHAATGHRVLLYKHRGALTASHIAPQAAWFLKTNYQKFSDVYDRMSKSMAAEGDIHGLICIHLAGKPWKSFWDHNGHIHPNVAKAMESFGSAHSYMELMSRGGADLTTMLRNKISFERWLKDQDSPFNR